jgi:hypothetical protein
LGGGVYTYNFPCALNQVTNIIGTVTVTPPNEATKTIDVTISKVGAGDPAFPVTKPGHRHFVRGRWQITKAFVRPVV